MTAVRTRWINNGTENVVTLVPAHWKADGSKYPIVIAHGYQGSELDAFYSAVATGGNQLYYALAAAGYPVISANCGGPATCGNDASITAFGASVSYAASALGAKSGKVLAAGISMGYLVAANWARQNVSASAGVLGLIPATDMSYIYTNGTSFDTVLDTAYGGHPAFLSSLPTHNPANYGPSTFTATPMLLVCSTDDNGPGSPPPGSGTVPGMYSSMQTAFISAMQAANPRFQTQLQTGGHALTNTNTAAIAAWAQGVLG